MKKYKDISNIEEGWGDFKDARAGGRTQADWVSPNGKVYKVKDTHIEFVVRYPKLFKTNIGTLKRTFDKHGEVFPKQEHHARIEILTNIVKSGWIRTRYRPRKGAWTVETHKWDKRAQKALMNWVKVRASGKKQFRINFVSTSKQKYIGHSFSIDYLQGAGIMEHTIDKKQILEASLSRIWRDFQDNEFGIITSWRVGSKDNKTNLSKLKSAVSGAGFGYVRIDGVGQEEDESGKVKSVKEPSLLVKNVKSGGEPAMDTKKFENFMVKLAHKYNQWGIVLHNPNKGTRLIQTSDDGKPIRRVDFKMSSFNPMKTGEFFSSLKGKPFKFEGFKYADKPQNHIHGMSLENKGEVNIYKRESTDKWIKEIMNIIEEVNLQESSLSRIWKHSQLHQTGTITAFRYARDCGEGKVYTKGENKARNKKLESKLLSKGYGITKIQGIYIENYKSNNEIEVKEESFFVVDLKDNKKLLSDLKKLGEEFDQDSICFGLEGGRRYTVFGTNDCPNAYPGKGKNIKLGDAIFGKSGEFMSRINGRPFIFSGSVKTKLPEMITYESLSIRSKEAVDKISNITWESFYVSNRDILENEK